VQAEQAALAVLATRRTRCRTGELRTRSLLISVSASQRSGEVTDPEAGTADFFDLHSRRIRTRIASSWSRTTAIRCSVQPCKPPSIDIEGDCAFPPLFPPDSLGHSFSASMLMDHTKDGGPADAHITFEGEGG
jgi:hypothetical protein